MTSRSSRQPLKLAALATFSSGMPEETLFLVSGPFFLASSLSATACRAGMEVPTAIAKADVLAYGELKEGYAREKGAQHKKQKKTDRCKQAEPRFSGKIVALGIRPPGERTSLESGAEFFPDACESRRVF